jgi:hypothetical protein
MRAPTPPFRLPSIRDAEIPWKEALAAVLGYARGTRKLLVRTPSYPDGHEVDVPAFAYSVYDCVPASADEGFAWLDVLVIDGLNGKLAHDVITALKDAGDRAWPHVREATARAAGSTFWELPVEEFAADPPAGSAGAAMTAAWAECMGTDQVKVALTHKLLHHKRPGLFPLIDNQTAPLLRVRADLAGTGLWAAVHAELTENARALAALEGALSSLLNRPEDARLQRLRLHDVLLWLTATRKWDLALRKGHSTEEWRRYETSLS